MLLMGFDWLACERMRIHPPTLTNFANVLNRLVLVLALVLPVELYAGEAVTEKAGPDQIEPCEPASNPEPGDAAFNQAVPRESCERLSQQEQEEEARSDIFDYIERFHNPRRKRKMERLEAEKKLFIKPSVEMG